MTPLWRLSNTNRKHPIWVQQTEKFRKPNPVPWWDKKRWEEIEFMAPCSTAEIIPPPCARAHLRVSLPCRMASQSHLGLFSVCYFSSPVNAWAPGNWSHKKTEVLPTAECTISVLQMKETVRHLVVPSPRHYPGEFGLRCTLSRFQNISWRNEQPSANLTGLPLRWESL